MFPFHRSSVCHWGPLRIYPQCLVAHQWVPLGLQITSSQLLLFCMVDPTKRLWLNWLEPRAEVMMCLKRDDRKCHRNGLCCQSIGEDLNVKYDHWILIFRSSKACRLFLWMWVTWLNHFVKLALDGLVPFSLDLWLRIPRECICNAANILKLVHSDLQMLWIFSSWIWVSIEVACKMQNCNFNINARKK